MAQTLTLSQLLQKVDIDLRKAIVLLKYLKSLLELDRSDINNSIYEKIFEIAVELVALNDILMPRMAARQLTHSNVPARTAKEYYLRNCFIRYWIALPDNLRIIFVGMLLQ